MKRMVLNVAVMLLAFGFGALCARISLWPAEEHAPPQHLEAAVATESNPDVAVIPEALSPTEPMASPTPILILDYDPKKFALSGYFEILGPAQKEFENFTIEMELFEGEGGGPVGYLSAGSYLEGNYHVDVTTFGFVTERRLFFITPLNPDSQVEYRFDGEFLRTDFYSVADTNQAVLRGRLTKIKNGRKITERVVSFRMYELHGC